MIDGYDEEESRTNLALGKGINRGSLKVTTIRLYEKDIERLSIHFRNKEQTLSQGIRKVLIDYMNKEGL